MGKITDINSATDRPAKKRGRPRKTDLEQTGVDIVKTETKKPRRKDMNLFGVSDADPGDNTKFVMVSMQLCNLPDIDLYCPEQVQERINEFFSIMAENDMKPTVAGLGLALNGLDRRRLYEIKNDLPKGGTSEWDLPKPTLVAIKKAYKLMENLWEVYMQNGKINPVTGIFLGKNNFNYVDKVEHVVTPNTKSDSDYSEEDMKRRYMIEDSGEVETTLED